MEQRQFNVLPEDKLVVAIQSRKDMMPPKASLCACCREYPGMYNCVRCTFWVCVGCTSWRRNRPWCNHCIGMTEMEQLHHITLYNIEVFAGVFRHRIMHKGQKKKTAARSETTTSKVAQEDSTKGVDESGGLRLPEEVERAEDSSLEEQRIGARDTSHASRQT